MYTPAKRLMNRCVVSKVAVSMENKYGIVPPLAVAKIVNSSISVKDLQ